MIFWKSPRAVSKILVGEIHSGRSDPGLSGSVLEYSEPTLIVCLACLVQNHRPRTMADLPTGTTADHSSSIVNRELIL
jgi:hypothetical protein